MPQIIMRPMLRSWLAPLAIAVPMMSHATGAAAQVTTFGFRERVVIRVKRLEVPPPKPIEWRETKGERCTALQGIAGAAFNKPGSVDLVFSDGRRLRARFGDDCPAIDFYSGFYIRPTADGQVCAKRDAVRSRSGAQCEIRAFRRLVPRR